MNCVVIGGGGFIGSHLTEELLNQKNEVTVFDRISAPNLEPLAKKGAHIYEGNFLEFSDLQNALVGADTIFHLVSTTVPKTSDDDPAFDIESNLVGSINLLNAALNSGVKKIIFASSGGTVYGVPQEIPISESHPTNPISSYGIIKLAIEKYLDLFWILHGLDYKILRIANAFGERQLANGSQGIIPTIITNSINQKEVHIWGNGSVIRDYIHVSDIVSALNIASQHEGLPKLFNIGSGLGHSVNDVVEIIEKHLNKPIYRIYEPGHADDVPINILDNSLALRELGWKPKVSFSDGLEMTINYLRDNIPANY